MWPYLFDWSEPSHTSKWTQTSVRAYHASSSSDGQVRASRGQKSSPVFSTADVAGLRGSESWGSCSFKRSSWKLTLPIWRAWGVLRRKMSMQSRCTSFLSNQSYWFGGRMCITFKPLGTEAEGSFIPQWYVRNKPLCGMLFKKIMWPEEKLSYCWLFFNSTYPCVFFLLHHSNLPKISFFIQYRKARHTSYPLIAASYFVEVSNVFFLYRNLHQIDSFKCAFVCY